MHAKVHGDTELIAPKAHFRPGDVVMGVAEISKCPVGRREDHNDVPKTQIDRWSIVGMQHTILLKI